MPENKGRGSKVSSGVYGFSLVYFVGFGVLRGLGDELRGLKGNQCRLPKEAEHKLHPKPQTLDRGGGRALCKA